ncbi:MAG: [FeFe] hydrogenase H-cluster radical SAM maturase HydE, partial [Clostridiaceae bacterium]|nr:[FeFe] hydrogenase H-cluster radical SAM maturase HydE [Clostridiaceae bacterium]
MSKEEFTALLDGFDKNIMQYLFSKSRAVADRVFGNKIYIRGLIEFTNYCKNDCYYCG